jgi:thiamine-monophosphate kinase
MPSEFDLIQRYFLSDPRRDDVIEGIGDDGAVIRPPGGHDLVISVDTLVEGVHFPSGTQAASVGHKALAVNLSDLAAMGAEPAWATLSLALPQSDEAWLAGFSHGLRQLADRFYVSLIGGDLARGPLAISIQVIGLLPHATAVCRHGARAGDFVFVTGSIGDAGLGLASMQGAWPLDGNGSVQYCLSRLNEPSPRVAAGVALRGLASAAIDVSDGLSADLKRMLAASGVGASIELTRIPLSVAARRLFGDSIDWDLVLTAGDDYELLFTVPATRADALCKRFDSLNLPITHIGYIEQQVGLRFMEDGVERTLELSAGYDHFAV